MGGGGGRGGVEEVEDGVDAGGEEIDGVEGFEEEFGAGVGEVADVEMEAGEGEGVFGRGERGLGGGGGLGRRDGEAGWLGAWRGGFGEGLGGGEFQDRLGRGSCVGREWHFMGGTSLNGSDLDG
jgi:hypothetical protein